MARCTEYQKLQKPTRKHVDKVFLRTATAYRSVSAKSIQIIAGVVSIDIMVKERVKLFNSGRGHIPEVRKAEGKHHYVSGNSVTMDEAFDP